MGSLVRNKICEEVRNSGHFTLMGDETRDISKKEQVSIVVRYVKASAVYERVQAQIRKLCPQAIYMHCFAHRLNLVLVDCSKNVEFVSEFFSVYQMLYLFLSSSAVLPVFEEVQRVAVLQSLKEIVATLEDLTENDRDSKRRVKAGGLLTHVRTFRFIFILVLLVKGLSITKGLSDQLQDDSLDLAAAAELVDSVLSSIRSSRSDKEWERTWKASVDLAERLGIAVVDVRRKGKKRNSQRLLTDMVVLDTTGRRDVAGDDSTEEMKKPLLNIIIEHMSTILLLIHG
ncbi:zinc finger MYM-type protein 1-like [Corticium candelabrum]|uniref:zinc finger MYM-type protein 1-like n=1 Tax=Corticium candelabrum TaxID=121492 RepID=UPI002E2643FC|nr:zinc finger MYM-type protein 1-like [Corticium candelabrum]